MKRNSNKLIRRRSAFTLVELLVVMFIVGMLATIAVPTVSEYLRVAKQGASLTVLGQIQGACALYKSDFEELPPSSALGGVYSGWQGCELLALFLTGYGPDKNSDGIPGKDWAKDDGHEGFGFRVERRGRVFPPYNGTEKTDMRRGASGRPYFVDAWDNPICYYRYDNGYDPGDNRGDPGNGPGNVAYARDGGGVYYRRDIWLSSRGNNGEWDAPSDGGENDDVTNFFSK